MPSRRLSFSNFDRRLYVSGGREQSPPGSLTIASGVAVEQTNSVMSRWGSELLYENIEAIQVYYWNGHRYQYDGFHLYQDGVVIVNGFDGGRLAFNTMPPQVGLPDYLFILGGRILPFKIDQSGNISNWGIVNPSNDVVASKVANQQIVIDDFEASAGNYTAVACAKANESTIVAVGSGSLSVNPAGTSTNLLPWSITQIYSAAQNWSYYTSGDFSVQTDTFQIWLYLDNFGAVQPGTWIEIDVDVNDGTFKKDWYSFAIGLLNPSAPTPNVRHEVQKLITFQVGQWQQITWAKSEFVRNGTNLELDWSMVQALRIKGGTLIVTTAKYYFDNFTLEGGSEMGAGPAVGNGGSEYDYAIVYRNLTTGSQSNPQDTVAKVFDIEVQQVALSNIPVSTDTQVTARDIYRSQALTVPGGGNLFYLDTIYDNTTTTYTDKYADFSIRLITTPWTKSIAVPPSMPTHVSTFNYYVDAGNGYYFKLKTAGTTGAAPPTWSIPNSSWFPHHEFALNETAAPQKAAGQFWQVTTSGVSGVFEPNWAGHTTPGNTITDGAVVWTNIGSKDTTDNTAVWTFQGINSPPVLSNDELLYDNAAPMITYDDAVGPYQNSMFFCRDAAFGSAGYVYASPPGRPESVGQVYQVSSTEDPTQKLVIWDAALWLLTSGRGFQGRGEYPAISFQNIDGVLGTTVPATVISTQVGIIYWAADGIRLANYSGSRLVGFDALSPVFRGQNEENLTAWSAINPPVWAAAGRDEIIFSDSVSLTLGLSYDGGDLAWRQPGQVLTALYFERQTGFIQACWGGVVYLFEQPSQLTDGGAPVPFMMQTMGDYPDPGAQFTTQRLYITVNCNGQILTPTLIVDGANYPLPPITNTERTTIEMRPTIPGRLFDGVLLSGSLSNRIEVFRIEADVYLGDEVVGGSLGMLKSILGGA